MNVFFDVYMYQRSLSDCMASQTDLDIYYSHISKDPSNIVILGNGRNQIL